MDRNMTMGMVALGIVGATVGVYAAANMKPRQRRKIIRAGKRAIGTLGIMKGLDML